MSNVSRIFVVEGEERLNQSLVTSLRKEGYFVQGAMSGTDAVRVLWSEDYDVVICDLKTQGIDGLELLQWLRVHRPNTRTIMLGSPGAAGASVQVLESGAASYLEKPVDLRVLKEELRRILQQTGLSLSLDSFDLLDVIQVVNMSRNNIALLVSTGLEEQGILRFQQGELVWAEYGTLRGEEAFFALAAHKNGTVIHQPWNGRITSNVTQPLSRLIFQALQYRTKYARMQQSSEHEAAHVTPFMGIDEVDDTPFGFLPVAEQGKEDGQSIPVPIAQEETAPAQSTEKGWWERTESNPAMAQAVPSAETADSETTASFKIDRHARANEKGALTPANDYEAPVTQRTDLPSWLTDQPTASHMRAVRPASPASATTPRMPRVPTTPIPPSSSPEWPSASSQHPPGSFASEPVANMRATSPAERSSHLEALSAWRSPDSRENGQATNKMQPLAPNSPASRRTIASTGPLQSPVVGRLGYNYQALVAALQSIGHAVPGFIATALASIEGQPIAQVAVDERDIAPLCKQYAGVLKGIVLSLEQNQWGDFRDTRISTADHFILLRLIGAEKRVFQLLITTREAAPTMSLQEMVNVEAAINQALGGK